MEENKTDIFNVSKDEEVPAIYKYRTAVRLLATAVVLYPHFSTMSFAPMSAFGDGILFYCIWILGDDRL